MAEDEQPETIELGLTIRNPEGPVVIAIGLVGFEGSEERALRVEAQGFEESDIGALDVADQLDWIAQGIRKRVGAPAVTPVPTPVSEDVPRFNPQPRKIGGQ